MFAKPAVGVFFDSDFSTIDSLLAVSLIYGLQGKNACRMAIVTLSRSNLAVAGFTDAVERFYHGPAGNFSQLPPVGMNTMGAAGDTSPAFVIPFQKKNADGLPVYINQVRTVIDTADPNTLIRNYLEAQYPQHSFFVLAGPATNLAAALEFPGMKELIAERSSHLVIAGGAFDGSGPEAHIKADIPAARKVMADWPSPIVMSGHEVGAALEFPGSSIDKEFAAAVPNNPVADAYRAYRPMPYNAPSGAMAAALFAIKPGDGYFKLSGPGTIHVQDDGATAFTPSAGGRHQYLIADPAQKDRILQAYVELASAKPVLRQRFRPLNVDADPADAAAPQKR